MRQFFLAMIMNTGSLEQYVFIVGNQSKLSLYMYFQQKPTAVTIMVTLDLKTKTLNQRMS